jgi:REP element-mobilizing transposase RayT
VLYLITFTCYGTHLPGDARGSFDHVRAAGRCSLPADAKNEAYHRRHLRAKPYLLSSPRSRELVRDAVLEVCRFRSWFLYALQVRTNHVHGIVEADGPVSQVLRDWKAYATRKLKTFENRADGTYWTHGGSGRRILTAESLSSAIDYVLRGQGSPMQVYWAEPRCRE